MSGITFEKIHTARSLYLNPLEEYPDSFYEDIYQGEQIREILKSASMSEKIFGQLTNLGLATLRVLDKSVNIAMMKNRTSYKGFSVLQNLIPKSNFNSTKLILNFVRVNISTFGTMHSCLEYVDFQTKEIVVLALTTVYKIGQMILEDIQVS
ncbi:MAG: hypothetical protein LBC43_04225 [Bifidobacteriaceae bacterium]|jgi:hypothetical protein|nr:hypothetical protein [Bifidobacteriaceae bacterium]